MKKKESKGPEFSKDGRMRPLLLWVFEIAVVLVLAAVVSIFFCQTIVMQEGGMEPTLATGDKCRTSWENPREVISLPLRRTPRSTPVCM